MQRFEGKVALITGGTNGMGYVTARQFINEGEKVIITGRSAETVNKAVEQLRGNTFGIPKNLANLPKLPMPYYFLLRRKRHTFTERN